MAQHKKKNGSIAVSGSDGRITGNVSSGALGGPVAPVIVACEPSIGFGRPIDRMFIVSTLDDEIVVDAGVIDDVTFEAYKRGQCFALAVALTSRLEGGRVGVILESFDDHLEHGDILEYRDPERMLDLDQDWFNYVRHAVAVDDNGNSVDIEGPFDTGTVLSDQAEFSGGDVVMVMMEPDELKAILGRTSLSVEQNYGAAEHMADTVTRAYEYGTALS